MAIFRVFALFLGFSLFLDFQRHKYGTAIYDLSLFVSRADPGPSSGIAIAMNASGLLTFLSVFSIYGLFTGYISFFMVIYSFFGKTMSTSFSFFCLFIALVQNQHFSVFICF